MNLHTEIISTLIALEAELRRLQLWDAQPPSPAALASVEPFCVDTLTLPQWLQFIFIPRIQALLDAERLLPGRCDIRPMAEESFNGMALETDALLAHIARLDELISTAG